jgi:hypothetical protein
VIHLGRETNGPQQVCEFGIRAEAAELGFYQMQALGSTRDGLFIQRLLFIGPPEMLARRPEAQVHLDLFEVLLDRPVALARATMR